MKLSCTQENLKKGLFMTANIAGQNSTLPILNNVLLEAKEGVLSLKATDLEIGITAIVRGKIEADGQYTTASKLLYDFVNLLPKDRVDLQTKEHILEMNCAGYHTQMNGTSAEDFPLIPNVERKEGITLSSYALKKAIGQTLFAVSLDESRPELHGVLFTIFNDTFTLVATDSYRLAERKLKLAQGANNGQEFTYIVPLKAVRELARILTGDGDVRVYAGENQMLFAYEDVEMVTRLIDGAYPDYKQIIPQNTKMKATVNREELSRAVRATGLFAQSGNNSVTVVCDPKERVMTLSASSSQRGQEVVKIPASIDGAKESVVFDYRYLLDGLINMDEEEVFFELIDAGVPALMRPKNSHEYIYIIMPIRQ